MRKQSKKQETKLTGKQELFVRYYLVSLNATDAARKAGYAGDENTLAVTGHNNLRNPKLAQKIRQGLQERTMPPEEVLTRLTQQARGEHTRFWVYDEYGRQLHLDMKALTNAGLGHLVKKFKCHELTGTITEVEFYDAQAALKLLGTHYRLFTERTELTGKDGGAIQYEDVGLTDTERAARIATIIDKARKRGA